MGWTVLVPAVVVLLLDQTAKRLAGVAAVNARGALVPLPPALALVLLAGAVAWVAAVLAAGPALPPAGALGLGLCLGGAASNLGDRLWRGGVVDHVTVGRCPAFNLADAALTAGAVLAAGSLLL